MTVAAVFGFIGILLLIGFLADFLFRKTSFPDILILIALGYLIGPVLKIVDPSQIAPYSEIIASLALVVILFSAGLEFGFRKLISGAPRAIPLVLLGVGVSIASITSFAYYLLDWGLLDSLLLGTIVGGTSSAIVVPLISRARVPEQVSTMLSLESALNSPIVIVLALVLIGAMSSGETGLQISIIGQDIGIRFGLGIGIGIALGFFWLWMLTVLEKDPYNDIATLAIVFLFYFVVEALHGSGVIFALVFGIMLGNGVSIARLLKVKRTIEATTIMRRFHSQISFLIKTFFFIYLGLVISFHQLGLVVLGVILSLILLFGRYIVVLLSSVGSRALLANSGILTTTFARGESTAVLTQIVLAAGILNASVYPDIMMAIIVTSVVISATGVLVFARKSRQQSEDVVQE
jgi:cell volume regulation protein A